MYITRNKPVSRSAGQSVGISQSESISHSRSVTVGQSQSVSHSRSVSEAQSVSETQTVSETQLAVCEVPVSILVLRLPWASLENVGLCTPFRISASPFSPTITNSLQVGGGDAELQCDYSAFPTCGALSGSRVQWTEWYRGRELGSQRYMGAENFLREQSTQVNVHIRTQAGVERKENQSQSRAVSVLHGVTCQSLTPRALNIHTTISEREVPLLGPSQPTEVHYVRWAIVTYMTTERKVGSCGVRFSVVAFPCVFNSKSS